MSRRRKFAIWYVIFCGNNHHITHTWKTKRAAKNCLRDLRKDFPEYDWNIKRLVEQQTRERRKRRRKKP